MDYEDMTTDEIVEQLKSAMLKEAQASPARKAVIVTGNPKYITGNLEADRFYSELEQYLAGLGYEVSRDPGEAYTSPLAADLWVGHSRGAGRLQYAPERTRTVALGVKGGLTHPEDNTKDWVVGDPKFLPNKYHYLLTDEMKKELSKEAQLAQPLPMSFAELPLTTPELYEAWKANPSPASMAPILKSVNPLIESQIQQYKGTLPPAALRANAKKFAIGAVKSFDPTKGSKLTTHMVNSLKQLHRKNYEATNAIRLSEELQRSMGAFSQAKNDLSSRLGRDPTGEELADELSWPISKIDKLGRQARKEYTMDDLLFDQADPEQNAQDPRIDYVYHDLDPIDKLVFEHKTGFSGAQTLSAKEIAKKLKITESAVSQRSLRIAQKLKEAVGI